MFTLLTGEYFGVSQNGQDGRYDSPCDQSGQWYGQRNLFASEGALVVVADSDVENGQETVRRIEESGGKAVFMETDVSQISEIQLLMQKVTEEYGRLDTVSYC